jgi:2-keto-4-pentenoate hydratase/2-oxohepta-3-ene-1,7-dioic acid hydratase in catechol pathway
MRLCTVRANDGEDVGIAAEDGIVLLGAINKALVTDFGPTLLDVVVEGQRHALEAALQDKGVLDTVIPAGDLEFAPQYRNAPKLWGVGPNYRRHADDLEIQQPKGAPGSYLRPNSTVIGYGDEILLPSQSERITAEAELGW